MNPPTTSSGQPSRPPASSDPATQRPVQVVPASLPRPTNYQPNTAKSTSSTDAARQYVNAHPQLNPQPKSPRATAFRPPVHVPGNAPVTVMNPTPRPPAPVQAVRPPAQQAAAPPTDDDDMMDDQVFRAYVDALAAMHPQARAALNAHLPAQVPPTSSTSTTGRVSPRPTDGGKAGTAVEEVRTAARAQGPVPVRVDVRAKVDMAGVQGKSGSPGVRPPQAVVQPASSAPSKVATIPQAPNVSNSTSKPSSTPKPRSTQSMTQPIKPITSTIQTAAYPSSAPNVSSATAAAAAAAAAWNARFGPTIDERLFSPAPSRASISSSAPVSSSAPTPSSVPATTSGIEVSVAPASSSAPPAVGNAAKATKEISLDQVADRRKRTSKSETTSSDESSDEDGVNALLGGDAARGEGGKGKESVVIGGVAPVAKTGPVGEAPVTSGGAATSSAPVDSAPPSAQPKEKSPAIPSSTTAPANSSPSAVAPTPPIDNATVHPSKGTQQPTSASSQGKKSLPSRPWKYHALVEEELVNGVWRQVGEVEGTHVEVLPAPRSASSVRSVSKEQEKGPELTSQRSARGGRGRGRGRGLSVRGCHKPGTLHRLSSQSAEITKNPALAERELVAVWGADFRQQFQVEAGSYHQMLLRLAGYGLTFGLTTAQIKRELFQARDARLAERKPGSRVTTVSTADINTVLKNLTGPGSGWAVKDENAENGTVEMGTRAASVTPKVSSARRKIASPKPGETHEPALPELSESERRSLRPVSRRRYIESDLGSLSDEDVSYRRRKRARYHREDAPSQRHVDRTPMDQLMVTSFLNFSQSAPDALGAGQEMNLRFGRDSTGAYYFTHTVHTEQPPISLDQGDGRTASIRNGYRLSPLTLGRLDDMLEISLAVPPPASAAPAPVSATSPLMNGTPAAKSSAAPSPARLTNTESTLAPKSLVVPDATPNPVATKRSLSKPAPIASPPAVDGAPKSGPPSALQSSPTNPTNALLSVSSAQSVKTSATAVAASTSASGPMDIDPAPKPKALNGVPTTNRVGSNPPGVNPAPEKMLVYPEASGSFIVSKPRTAAVPIVPPGSMPPQ